MNGPTAPDDMTIHHVALAEDWTAALTRGTYEVSTRGKHLDEVGFIHCARADQVAGVIERFYADVAALVLLSIDVRRLDVPVVHEPPAPGIDERFPHVYGPIPCAAVVEVTPIDRTGRSPV